MSSSFLPAEPPLRDDTQNVEVSFSAHIAEEVRVLVLRCVCGL